MKKLLLLSIALLVVAAPLFAQTTITFTWNGSTDWSSLVPFSTVDGQPVNSAIGYTGGIKIVDGEFLNSLFLPESLMPEGGSLECAYSPMIQWGPKQWVIGDGTHAGDAYKLTGTTTCGASWNSEETVPVSITAYREEVPYHYRNRTWLVDTMENGWGSVTVQ